MLQPSNHRRQLLVKSTVLLLSAASVLVCGAEDSSSRPNAASLVVNSGLYLTNVAQFRTLSEADYLVGCNFRLTGVFTLVDTNRDLVVLQDATGAVALNFHIGNRDLQVGQFVVIDGTNSCPLFRSFPDYPYYPSGWNICSSFEAPMNWGEYNLTRMRGYLHPEVTGAYTFWIASDNSSELWLSPNADPSKVRKIASIPRFGWVLVHEWSRYPSQRSEPIQLEAGKTYYIEALQEQTTVAENFSVAWQGPGLPRSVITGPCLTPWNKDRRSAEGATNGILREYWTNYWDGDLSGVGGARPFESALTIKKVGVRLDSPGKWPKPIQITMDQPLPVENNYRWVQAEGVVTFEAVAENSATLELSDGQAQVQVRVKHWSGEMSRQLKQSSNLVVRVDGVCEGVYDQNGTLMPGLIWASAENSISFLKTVTTNKFSPANQPAPSMVAAIPAIQGFYGTRGVITFNDRVFDKHYVFVQEDDTAMLVSHDDLAFKNQLEVGQGVDLGGALEPGKYLQVITPLVVTELGWYSMPKPITHPLGIPNPASLEGRWSELEGVIHSVNTNGTLTIVGKDGPAYLWPGKTPTNSLAGYVDAEVCARGVLMPNMLDEPLLLIPSRNFLDVKEEAPKNPFGIPGDSIAYLLSGGVESSWSRRVRVVGEVTYQDAHSFFIQDATGGIRVRTTDGTKVKTGETFEVLAFPAFNGFIHTLTEPLVRPSESVEHVIPKDLDLSEALSSKQSGTLIRVSATMLACKTNGENQVLELQEQQHVFVATLAANRGRWPDIVPGSRLRITGVCDDQVAASPLVGEMPPRPPILASLNILLRSPQDVAVLSGPPWWTWRKIAMLVGTLLTILGVTLLWVHLLHRRLERQQAAQLAFSRHVLERLENERRRIAVNLHDSLGQTLMVIKNHAILAIDRPPEEPGLRNRLEEISGATSQAIEEVRRITHGLRPYQLDRLGLTQAVRALTDRASRHNSILFASRINDIDDLFDKDSEIHVYRIVQEAITNVVKHSAATEATVVVKKWPSVVSLSIRDNGRGFDPAKQSAQRHDLGYGLSGIAERVRILKGTLAIDSKPGEGTSLTVEVPIPNPRL
jgi:signal transduction histidine kinase